MPYLNWIDDSDLQNEVKNLLEKANLLKLVLLINLLEM